MCPDKSGPTTPEPDSESSGGDSLTCSGKCGGGGCWINGVLTRRWRFPRLWGHPGRGRPNRSQEPIPLQFCPPFVIAAFWRQRDCSRVPIYIMKNPESPLHLYEEAMLLALRNREGTAAGSLYPCALGGALLSELFLEGRLKTVPGWMRPLVEIVDATPLHDELLDECLRMIVTAKRRCSAEGWVGRFSRIRRLKHRVAEGLCRRGILKSREGKVLWVFSRTLYPEADARPERSLIDRLRRVAASGRSNVDPRTKALLAVVHPSGLLKEVFEKDELKRRKERIERLIKGDIAGKATKDAVSAVHAAVATGAMVPILAAS